MPEHTENLKFLKQAFNTTGGSLALAVNLADIAEKSGEGKASWTDVAALLGAFISKFPPLIPVGTILQIYLLAENFGEYLGKTDFLDGLFEQFDKTVNLVEELWEFFSNDQEDEDAITGVKVLSVAQLIEYIDVSNNNSDSMTDDEIASLFKSTSNEKNISPEVVINIIGDIQLRLETPMVTPTVTHLLLRVVLLLQETLVYMLSITKTES
ncbi:hypothetical protein [Psychromonas ossibalaenae]|uniref:hypothetical protein n=1 Tax=Psychromonas ossibalaenae TaxID=444922 RepID=UPI0003A00B6F|nr:hypothetical protein [Psychromonas ossibalaenae]